MEALIGHKTSRRNSLRTVGAYVAAIMANGGVEV